MFDIIPDTVIINRNIFNPCIRKKHGNYKPWYKNGTLQKECFYSKDSLDGTYRAWYEDGSKKGKRTVFIMDGIKMKRMQLLPSIKTERA